MFTLWNKKSNLLFFEKDEIFFIKLFPLEGIQFLEDNRAGYG
jgi:hypothetical protein